MNLNEFAYFGSKKYTSVVYKTYRRFQKIEHIQFTQSTYLKLTQETDLYYKRFVHQRKYVQFTTHE